MAVNSYDPVDGHPTFSDSDAPDIKVDPEAVSEYAGQVGTRLIGSTAERVGYDYSREGLEWYDTDLDGVYLHDGSGWGRAFKAKTSFTPSFSNLTLGSSAASGWYQIIGNVCEGFVSVTLGSGWAMSGNVLMNVPVAPVGVDDGIPMGEGLYLDAGTGYFAGRLLMNGSGAARLVYPSGSFFGSVTATAPFGWATGDEIQLQFRYGV